MYRDKQNTPDETRERSEIILTAIVIASVLAAIVLNNPVWLLFGGIITIAYGLWYFTGARTEAINTIRAKLHISSRARL